MVGAYIRGMLNMMNKFKQGDTAFIIESKIFIREVEIIRFSSGMYTVRFKDSGGGIKLKEERLYRTKDEAEKNTRK